MSRFDITGDIKRKHALLSPTRWLVCTVGALSIVTLAAVSAPKSDPAVIAVQAVAQAAQNVAGCR